MKIRIRTFVVVAMASSLAFGVTTVASAGGHGGGVTAVPRRVCTGHAARLDRQHVGVGISRIVGMPGQELRYAVNVFNTDAVADRPASSSR
jgi:hypothetical protein